MVRTPCREAGANSPQQQQQHSKRGGGTGVRGRAGRVCGEEKSEEVSIALPPCIEGSRSLEFAATKKAAVPGKNGGSWTISASVKVGRKIIFERKSSLVFGLSDDIPFRDAECQAQLRTELGEVWHRMTCSPKETCRLEEVIGGTLREFKGTRSVRLAARKWRKGKKFLWHCSAQAHTDHAGFARLTTFDYVAEADASRSSAAALHLEIAAVWRYATRGENETYEDDFRGGGGGGGPPPPPLRSSGGAAAAAAAAKSTSHHEANDDENDENDESANNNNNQGPPTRRGAMRYIRDVYGASSNVEAVVNRAPRV